jgi:uncharacterized protein (DUF885 family)
MIWLLLACSKYVLQEPVVVELPTTALNADATAGVSDPVLAQLVHDHWEATLARWPVWATELGDDRYSNLLSDPTLAAGAAWGDANQGFLVRALAIDAAELSESDALTLSLLIMELENATGAQVCRFSEWSISARRTPLGLLTRLPELHDPGEPALIARYRAIPEQLDVGLANVQQGAAEGLVTNRASLERVIGMVDGQLAQDTAEWAPVTAADADRAVILDVMETQVRPALVRYRDGLTGLLDQARVGDQVGLVGLPIGDDCYEHLRGKHLGGAYAAEFLHQSGLNELERIHAEMAVIADAEWGVTSVADIRVQLQDPVYYFETEDQVEQAAWDALHRAEAAVPAVFDTLPQIGCEVKRVPDALAPYTTIAWYQPTNGVELGAYFVNTYDPTSRPRFEAEVLAFHEAVPGHHTQIARAVELPGTPAFRRHIGVTAFVEGWALYTERLSDELGLYSGPLDRLGMLSFDSWRASRLVVDTGIHRYGWTREQAEQFLVDNTLLAPNNISNEVDRYITTPGQALAYKTGQLELLRIRADAQEQLGDAFDLGAFHDVVLGAGAVPLPVVEQRVDAWIARTLRAGEGIE